MTTQAERDAMLAQAEAVAQAAKAREARAEERRQAAAEAERQAANQRALRRRALGPAGDPGTNRAGEKAPGSGNGGTCRLYGMSGSDMLSRADTVPALDLAWSRVSTFTHASPATMRRWREQYELKRAELLTLTAKLPNADDVAQAVGDALDAAMGTVAPGDLQ